MTIKIIALYTGSSYPKIDGPQKNEFIEATKLMAHIIGENAELVLYGGGLYGHLLDIMEEIGKTACRMKAIIPPAYFKEHEVYPNHVDVVRVHSDEERFNMFSSADASVVSSGGDGTFAEGIVAHNRNLSSLFSGLSLKPVIYLNTLGYYNSQKAQFETAKLMGYSNDERQAQLYFRDTPQEVAQILWPDRDF